MKMKMILMMVLISICALEVSAQRGDRQDRDPYENEEYAAMVDSMNLDAEQKQQFDALEAKYKKDTRTKMRAAREGGGDRETMRAEMQKSKDGYMMILSNMLTEDQVAVYSRFQEQMQAKRGERGGRGGRGQRGGGGNGGG